MAKILVVDDDKVALTMLQMLLARAGHEVVSAKDGAEGYELAQKNKPDLLISDMLLPKIDGMELCRKIKENPELNKTKIILITAVYKGMTFKFEAKDCGADDLLNKPIDSKYLMGRVRKLLSQENR
jgi:DNA-binding response OmpR family regulator